MKYQFAQRMGNVKKSFIREIFKVLENKDVISFSGGFPNPESFPVEGIALASQTVLFEDGKRILQYSSTEGYLPLRKMITDRYKKHDGLSITPEEVLIVNGSQQALDLIFKVFLNPNDHVLIERPAYLGAIQSLSMYEPTFHTAELKEDGIDLEMVESILKQYPIKIMYTVPNFQNPTGITYNLKNRQKLAELIKQYDVILIEDDPYCELRFIGEDVLPIKTYVGDNGIMLGSFSKIVSPGMRMGWVVACPEIMDKLVVAKQASDLHSNYFTQRVIFEYLSKNEIDTHIEKIKHMYKGQREYMIECIKKYFPPEVIYTQPEGGMFMWATLPVGMSSLELFNLAVKENVVFVPGDPFYVNESNVNTLRLNYTNTDAKEIEEGIKRLGKAIYGLMQK